jgi:NADP-dependent 3-hydroxy acid dehydrogenase YdfG
MEISGKVMIITGASSGIGAATARVAAEAGARLVLAARRKDRLEALAEELGALAMTTDMRDPEQIHRLVEAAVDRYGGVDVLINNAGQGLHVPLEEIRVEDLASIMQLNVYGALLAMQAVIPVMRSRGGGSIVNVSSGTTRMPSPAGASAYAATKAALNTLSQAARAELADDGIAVSTIYPFVTVSEFHDTLRAGSGPRPRPGLVPDTAERVADVILDLVRTGDAEAVLVPEHLRGGSA